MESMAGSIRHEHSSNDLLAASILGAQPEGKTDDPETILLIDSWTDQRSRRISKPWWP